MRALRYHGVQDLRLEHVPVPTIADGEVLVRVAYAGICGSDLHVFGRGMFGITPPMTMGHEFSGTVEGVGGRVEGMSPGDLVVGDPRVGCGQCEWCLAHHENLCPALGFIGEVRPGSYAEYVVMPAAQLLRVNGDVGPLAAALVEPLAVAVHTVALASMTHGSSVGIIGVGPIGLLCLLVAQERHDCRVAVVDPREKRLQLARRLGAERTMRSLDEAAPSSTEVVIEAAGKSATLAGALTWVKPRGVVTVVAIYEDAFVFDPSEIVAKEVVVQGVNSYERADLEEAVSLLETHRLDPTPIVSQVLPLEAGAEVLSRLLREGDGGKVLLTPQLNPV